MTARGWGIVTAALLLAACKGSRTEDLQAKLDSIARVELQERIALQQGEESTGLGVRAFFDKLNVMPLPLRYSDNLVDNTPGFTDIPALLCSIFNVVPDDNPRCIALGPNDYCHTVLVSLREDEDNRSLWLYTFDNDYYYQDRLPLYDPAVKHLLDEDNGDYPVFTIMSNFVVQNTLYISDDVTVEMIFWGIDETAHFYQQAAEYSDL